jgi:hypothetical protein
MKLEFTGTDAYELIFVNTSHLERYDKSLGSMIKFNTNVVGTKDVKTDCGFISRFGFYMPFYVAAEKSLRRKKTRTG